MLRTIEKAVADPVSLAEVKARLRIDAADDDEVLNGLIGAATFLAQARVQRRFVNQTVEWVLPCWRRQIALPIAPVIGADVISIKYADPTTGGMVDLDPSLYVKRTVGDSVVILPRQGFFWPFLAPDAAEPIVIRFRTGVAAADVVANVKAAIMLIVGHLYEHRESVIVGSGAAAVEMPQGAEALLMSECW